MSGGEKPGKNDYFFVLVKSDLFFGVLSYYIIRGNSASAFGKLVMRF